MKSVSQNAGEYWCWIAKEEAIEKSAVQGVYIALLFAFFVVFAATRNIITSFFAILCVTIVIASEVALMVVLECELGIAEAIAAVMVTGLSIDYCVHLAIDYMS